MTSEQISALATLLGENKPTPSANNSVWEIGKSYYIQTVTWAYTGTLARATDMELVIENAALIADTGRFADAMKSEEFDEVEPFRQGSEVIVGRYSVVSATQISKLPTQQK